MKRKRLPIVVACAIDGREFHPWNRQQTTCSIKCARALTGRGQRGKPMVKALAGVAAKRAYTAVVIGRRFGATLTSRELAIFVYGVKLGRHQAYNRYYHSKTETNPAAHRPFQAASDSEAHDESGGD